MLTTTPAIEMNAHQQFARARKVLKLTMALDGALDMMGCDPFSPAALEFVLAMNEKAWAEATKHAHCEPPSETTKEEVRDIYRVRVETRRALADLRGLNRTEAEARIWSDGLEQLEQAARRG